MTVGGSSPANVVDVVELVLAVDGVEEVVAELRDRGLEVGDAPGRERAAHELAQLRVLGRVHHDHHRDARRAPRVIISSTDAVARHERLGVEQPVEHVVVAAQRVEPVLLVPVQRRFVAQPLPDRVRVGVDRVVVRVVVELGRRSCCREPPGSSA